LGFGEVLKKLLAVKKHHVIKHSTGPRVEQIVWHDVSNGNLQEVGSGDMDWIDLAEDRDKWRALVNTVVNLWVP
jgi:hypothetical protein